MKYVITLLFLQKLTPYYLCETVKNHYSSILSTVSAHQNSQKLSLYFPVNSCVFPSLGRIHGYQTPHHGVHYKYTEYYKKRASGAFKSKKN
jgi:hypothetical protein